MGTGDHNAGGLTIQWTGIPSMGVGGSNIPSHFVLQKPSADLMGHLALKQTLPYLLVLRPNNMVCRRTWVRFL